MSQFDLDTELTTLEVYEGFVYTRFKEDTVENQLIHAALGIAGESGELVDAIKKHVIYGKELDTENVIEEIGDLMFYMTAMLNTLDITIESVLEANTSKLTKRYPTKYTNKDALERKDKE